MNLPGPSSRSHWHRTLFLAVLLTCLPAVLTTTPAKAAALVRLKDGKQAYEGKVVGLSRTRCSLVDRQGQLVRLNVSALKSIETLSSRFEPEPVTTFRDHLKREFGNNYDVAGTRHYLVCAPRGRTDRYGQLFEDIYRDTEHFFRVNGFRVHEPDVPLVAVVFGSQREFVQYCIRDNVPPSPGLMGYYSLKTNRVALFDDPRWLTEAQKPARLSEYAAGVVASHGISGQTTNTIIHETVHQVGYNIGIHSRLGGTPVWVVEGLATVLEPDGMRNRTGRQLQQNRFNAERKGWFEAQHRPGRTGGNLARLIASDDYFHQHQLDSYSEAWAFNFFVLENSARRRNLIDYLQRIGQRDASKQYSARDRLADFQAAFGDISRLETEFIRFMDRL